MSESSREGYGSVVIRTEKRRATDVGAVAFHPSVLRPTSLP